MEESKPKPKGFDLMVTHRDERTGMVTHTTPYILRVCGEPGSSEKSRYWERPAGSGNLFDKQNNPVGRWVYTEEIVKGKKIRTGKHAPDEKHIAFTPPKTQDQMLREEASQAQVRIAELEKELASIQAEKNKAVNSNASSKKG